MLEGDIELHDENVRLYVGDPRFADDNYTIEREPMTQEEQIKRAAEIVGDLSTLIHEHNSVNVGAGSYHDPFEIDVHHCQPDHLEEVQARFPSAQLHRDADDIVRRIEIREDEYNLTFYRR